MVIVYSVTPVGLTGAETKDAIRLTHCWRQPRYQLMLYYMMQVINADSGVGNCYKSDHAQCTCPSY